MPAELTEQSTHEDIQAAVNEIVESRKGDGPHEERALETVVEDRDKPTEDIPAEDDSGSDDTAPKGEEAGAADDRAWLDDELKADLAASGIDETEIADFTSREEVERAMRFFERSTLEAGRKAIGESEPGEEEKKPQARERDKRGRFLKGQSAPEPEPVRKAEPTLGQYDINLGLEAFDDELNRNMTRALTGLRDHYESRLAAVEERLETRFAELDQMARQQEYDAAIDAMGHADLFGKTGHESPDELERRRTLLPEVEAYLIGLRMQGREPGSYNAVVSRVAGMVFAKELGRKELKSRTRKLMKQSAGRMGGPAGRAPEPVEDPREAADRLYKEMAGL